MMFGYFVLGCIAGGAVMYFLPFHYGKTIMLDTDSVAARGLRRKADSAVQNRIEKRKDRIVNAAQAQGKITNDGVEELFCISDRTAGRYLRELVKEERIKKVGNVGRGVYYTAK